MTTLDPDRERRALEIVDHASEQPIAAVDGYVAAACAGDAELRARVEALLAAASSPNPLLVDLLDPPPIDIGRYRVDRLLGEGGSSRVFAGTDPSTGDRVAIKLLRRPFTAAAADRFEREAQALARVRNPGIVAVHEVGAADDDDATPFLVLEFVAGETLADRELAADPIETAALVARAAWALHAAHELGVIHRDVKPENLIVRRGDDGPCWIDFGIALDETSTRMTKTGEVVGTLAYLAPEQLDGASASSIDARTDVYALGALLYRALTGHDPFESDRRESLVYAILAGDPPSPRRHRPTLPRALEAICLHALSRRPADRYGSAAAFAADLERVVAGRRPLARSVGPARRFVRRSYRRHRAATFASAIAALALVVAAVTAPAWWERESLGAELDARDSAHAFDRARRARDAGRWSQCAVALADARAAGYDDPVELELLEIELLRGRWEPDAALERVERLRARDDLGRWRSTVELVWIDLTTNWFSGDRAAQRALATLDLEQLAPADREYALSLRADGVNSALAHLVAARRHDPYHRRVNESYGLMLLTAGKVEDSERFAVEFRTLSPEDPSGLLFELFAATVFGPRDRAVEILETVRTEPSRHAIVFEATHQLLEAIRSEVESALGDATDREIDYRVMRDWLTRAPVYGGLASQAFVGARLHPAISRHYLAVVGTIVGMTWAGPERTARRLGELAARSRERLVLLLQGMILHGSGRLEEGDTATLAAAEDVLTTAAATPNPFAPDAYAHWQLLLLQCTRVERVAVDAPDDERARRSRSAAGTITRLLDEPLDVTVLTALRARAEQIAATDLAAEIALRIERLKKLRNK